MSKWFYIYNDIDYDWNPLETEIGFTQEDYYKSMEEDFKNFINEVESQDNCSSVNDLIKVYRDKYFNN